MLAATIERPGVQGWALKVTSIRGTRQLMVNHFVLFWSLALHYADTLDQAVSGTRRPNIIWWVQRQQWYLITLLFLVCVTNYYKDSKLQSMKVTLHSHHTPLTPSKQRGWIHALTGQYLRYVRSASFLWWMQHLWMKMIKLTWTFFANGRKNVV